MIEHWSSGDPAQAMSEDILTDLGHLIAAHPWFQARAKMAVAVLGHLNVRPPARVLDAGCGWGLNLAALEGAGYRAVGLDRDLIEADLTAPFPHNAAAYDAVLALDVIEHLDDDQAAAEILLYKTGMAADSLYAGTITEIKIVQLCHWLPTVVDFDGTHSSTHRKEQNSWQTPSYTWS